MKKKKLYQNKKWIYQKYINEKLTTRKIGEICNVDKGTIRDWLIRYYVIKALSEFDPIAGLDEIMNLILEDKDLDVRQIAINYFLKNKT